MPQTEKDTAILQHIIRYCLDIEDAVLRFGNSYRSFANDKEYRNACALCILQIGELVGHLSADFKSQHSDIPWRQIQAMRNVVAHAYGSVRVETTWETIQEDIPFLKDFCLQQI